ncbi:uncharacterized protein CTHT_0008620 [Thermochaetoides thermophila DSM 1495]|uniref:GTP-binding protein n=1 Tax=Chaetomium thermophilum (strain DSM 1495 / CBS 144.50 / IMI 039719) TaxID=759272 RepID=G0S038_CHATD|nr:hypothetical protein CTHT_0008620 [Thermochaetoides thermophila DSM 1495]EGS23199.1 hypothetical protein CTHT_0008620 [Thermochaetoides thermophila DSM 1495]
MSSPPWDYIAKLVCIGDSGCGKSSLTIRLCEGRFVTHHDVTIGVEFGSRIVPVGPPYSNSSESPLNNSSSSTTDDGNNSSTTAGGLPEPRIVPAEKPGEAPPHPQQKHMKLSLWDTAGQETYKSVTRSYFRGASGALLVFDLTRRSTFEHVTDWLNDLRQIAEPDIVVVLVGNKADLANAEPPSADNNSTQSPSQPPSYPYSPHQKKGVIGPPPRREVTRAEAEDWARRNGVLEYVETSAKSGENVEKAFMRVAEKIFQNIQAGKYDLNDRRSGVKGAHALQAGGTSGSGPGRGGGGGSVKLTGGNAKGVAGGCC